MIGTRIKQLRKHVNLTLSEVAKRTGLSVGYLSNVERETTSPTFDNLQAICSALNINIVALITSTMTTTPVVRKGERREVYSDNYRIKCELTSSPYRKMKGVCLTIAADYYGEESSWGHDGDEFGVIVKGSMLFEVDGAVYVLSEGDTMYICANTPHKWKKVSDGEAISYWTLLNTEGVLSREYTDHGIL